jgi:16S rRNA (cytosine1402-N4)-methyltransferase
LKEQGERDPAGVHEPVLLEEVIRWLRPDQGGLFIDCTLGAGGHAKAILEASHRSQVIGIDRDPEALEIARERLKLFDDRFQAVHANFRELPAVLDALRAGDAQGVLADLGVSSLQFDRAERGFSFSHESPLDMRMDRTETVTAADLVNTLSERELADLIFEYGEERGARRIARLIARERERQPIETTRQLSDIVVRAIHPRGRWRIHPATRTFQALRIAVNGELDAVKALVGSAISALAPGGRLAVISFHSLEDRLVKRAMLRESGRCICEDRRGPAGVALPQSNILCGRCGAQKRVEVLTRKPVRPRDEEVARNPRSRSALLRVCERN